MDKFQAIEILEEVKMFDDSMYQYNDAYMEALDTVLDTVRELDRDIIYRKSNEIVNEFLNRIEKSNTSMSNWKLP